DVASTRWNDLPPKRFFTEILLDAIVGEYYAHPHAWSEIGFGGPASPRGYVRLGLNQRDPWEAKK
ncbi:MAG: gluconate 2-dehydrogenase subunit 3 family protein, partial [Thermoanaerobaculia bacterium]